MASFNRFLAIGNVTRDPELRYTPQGAAVASFTIAVDGVRDDKGERRTDFFPVTVWEKQAEACAKHLQKGALVHVEGHLRQDRWEAEGEKRSRLEVIGDRVTFLGGIRKADAPPPTPADAPAVS
jgi:single-strand DNA-binding protein